MYVGYTRKKMTHWTSSLVIFAHASPNTVHMESVDPVKDVILHKWLTCIINKTSAATQAIYLWKNRETQISASQWRILTIRWHNVCVASLSTIFNITGNFHFACCDRHYPRRCQWKWLIKIMQKYIQIFIDLMRGDPVSIDAGFIPTVWNIRLEFDRVSPTLFFFIRTLTFASILYIHVY